MFGLILKSLDCFVRRLPENKAAPWHDEILRGRRNRELFARLRSCSGFDEFIDEELLRRSVRLDTRTKAFLCRGVASEVHRRGQRYILGRAASNMKSGRRSTTSVLLAVHEFAWGQELADAILAQAWGRLGRERRFWLGSGERSKTESFGVDSEFERRFVETSSPLYERIETISDEVLSGAVYALRVS